MRVMALGLCAVCALLSFPVSAATIDAADRNVSSHSPAATNDHDGAFIPSTAQDRNFAINPDGTDKAAYYGDADQDEDGSDAAIYQGEDDILPA